MKALFCFLLGTHKYEVAQELAVGNRRLCCTRCGRSFAMNDDLRSLIDWDDDFHRLCEAYGIKLEYKPWERYGKTEIEA